ncbi:hypothetical protein M758_8G152100 [Ceratodon purpureus]|nr:hypothetical protein M758_8G152100 [Ceratodon purpureus]KAG0609040.1 hypothetical protein M758_8G152100 [Ceratodon purpureus]
MASTTMTRVRTRSAIFLLLAVTLVGVQGRPYPEDFTSTDRPQIPYTYPFWSSRNIPKVSSHVESQATNLDESQFWASTQTTQDASRFTRPREGLAANEYNYATEGTNKRSQDNFFTPEMLSRVNAYNELQQTKSDREMQNQMTPAELAQVKAFNEAQEANFNREMQNYEAKTATTTGKNEYPKMLPDGTELLWETGPQKDSPEEMARWNAWLGNPKSTAPSLPGSQRHEVQSSSSVPVFDVNSSNWEDGPWGTKHRPGAEHSLEYVGYEQPDGATVTVPHSFNNP